MAPLYLVGLTLGWASTAEAAPLEAWLDAVVLVQSGPSLCAGVLIDEEGGVATAYHCVSSGRRPEVSARDGGKSDAKILASDPKADLAILSAPALAGRAPLPLREDSPLLGETVWALGHPFGGEADRGLFDGVLMWSASAGVVSAVGERLVQIDAPLNPGSSGGPVVDEQGRVVGIVSRKLRGEGLGLIAPSAALLELRAAGGRRPGGGELSVGPQLSMPSGPGASVSLGGYAEGTLRDLAVLRVDLGLPVGARWTALALGQSWWLAGSASLSGRLRVGRGPWSTAFDLGAGVQVLSGYEGRVSAESLYVVPQSARILPAASARLSFGGVALRMQGSVWEEDWVLSMTLDLERPGKVGVW